MCLTFSRCCVLDIVLAFSVLEIVLAFSVLVVVLAFSVPDVDLAFPVLLGVVLDLASRSWENSYTHCVPRATIVLQMAKTAVDQIGMESLRARFNRWLRQLLV